MSPSDQGRGHKAALEALVNFVAAFNSWQQADTDVSQTLHEADSVLSYLDGNVSRIEGFLRYVVLCHRAMRLDKLSWCPVLGWCPD